MLSRYFPFLTEEQKTKLESLQSLYAEWNSRINVISRKDIENFTTHHLLHSLSISLFFDFSPGTEIMDAGTGGGFPGIPLAIMFPDVQFTLVDSIGKKIKVVNEISKNLGLLNVIGQQARFEDIDKKFDFVTGRAVTSLPVIFRLLKDKVRPAEGEKKTSRGIIYLKGGDFNDELLQIKAESRIWNLSDYFEDQFFETKKLVHLFGF